MNLKSSLFLLPPISFLAYKNYHSFGSSKGSKARGKHSLVSVVFMHQGVRNSQCVLLTVIPKTTMVGLHGSISQWGNPNKILGTDSLMSPLKDTKENLTLRFLGTGLSALRREINVCCKWDWNDGPLKLCKPLGHKQTQNPAWMFMFTSSFSCWPLNPHSQVCSTMWGCLSCSPEEGNPDH